MTQVYRDFQYTGLTDETVCNYESDTQALCEIFVCVLLFRKEWLMKVDLIKLWMSVMPSKASPVSTL
jgi:hypothetical protein